MAPRGVVLSTLLVLSLLAASPLAAAEDGDDYGGGYGGDEYGDESSGYGGDGDYGDYGGMGGGGSMGAGDQESLAKQIKGVLDLDDVTFDKVVDGTRPVFIEFYAPSCGECKDFIPIYGELAEALSPHPELLLAKVDAAANTALAKRFSIDEFPTLMFLGKDGAQDLYEDMPHAAEDIRDFLTDRVGEVGQLKILTPFVEKFRATDSVVARANIIKEAETAVANLSPSQSVFGKWYLKVLSNMAKKGDGYVQAEFSRLMKIVYDQKDSLKEEKLAEFRIRMTVLKDFDGSLKALEKAKREEIREMEEAMMASDESEGAGEGDEHAELDDKDEL